MLVCPVMGYGIKEAMGKKENSGNRGDCQSSPLKGTGDPYGTRTRVAAVKGRSLNRLTNGPRRPALIAVKQGDGSGNWI